MTKKILIITLAILSIGISSCKKNSKGSNPEPEGIFNKQLNQSYSDITPTQLYALSFLDDTTVAALDKIYLLVKTDLFSLTATSSQELAYIDGANSDILLKVYASGETISSANSWDDGNSGGIFGYRTSGIVEGDIRPGAGDKYIGIRLTLNDNKTHYGWILLDYSSNGKTVTIKEYAYNNKADESIKAGQK